MTFHMKDSGRWSHRLTKLEGKQVTVKVDGPYGKVHSSSPEAEPEGYLGINSLAVHLHIFVTKATVKEFMVDENEGKAFGVPFRVGRPDIMGEFKSLKSGHKGENFAVLFCGPRKLGYKVRTQCVKRSSLTNKTRLHLVIMRPSSSEKKS